MPEPVGVRPGEKRETATATLDWRLRLPFFYGWVVVAGAFLALAVTYSVWYSFSVFYVALLEEFGWSRAASAGVFSLFVVTWALGGMGAGAMADRWGPGRVMAGGVIALAAGLLACSQLTELWHFYLFFGIICALGFSCSAWIPCVIVVSRWFSARLGAAVGIASAGIGLGILVMVPLTQLLISALGWRTAYSALAAIILLGVTPIALLVLRGAPEDLGLLKDGRRAPSRADEHPVARPSRVLDRQWASRDWTVGTAARTRKFWLVFAMMALSNVAIQMIFVHQVAFLVDGGYGKLLAASVVGVIGLLSVGSKIGWGWMSDRAGREATYALGTSMLLLAIGLLAMTRLGVLPWLAYGYAAAFALGYAVAAPIGPAVAADLFIGPRFGAIYGALGLGYGLGAAVGAWLAGYIFDLTGSYLLAFAFAAFCDILSVIALWLAAPRKVRRVPGRS